MSSLSNPSPYGQIAPRYIGPIGNRVSAVAGVPGNHLIYYAGAASGGIWKTTDGGVTWSPVFDGQAAALDCGDPPAKVSSIGALAVADSDPNIVWAGTGESWIRGPISIGNGIYRSVDGGASWTHMGLSDSGRFSKIVIHPTDPDIVWAGAVGSCYARSKCRGVFKTTDGGLSWRRVLCAEGELANETGCSDIAIDPTNPAVLYAGLWQFRLRSWTRVSGGQGSGLYKSVDYGETWTELTHGLPTGMRGGDGKPLPVGKISVGVAASNPDYVYANIETGDGIAKPELGFPYVGNGQLFRSTDGGATWSVRNYNRWLNSRAAYYTRNAVSPDNENEVYFFSPRYIVSHDGGNTLELSGFPEAPGVDHHEGWIDPTNGDRIAVASDFGLGITQNRGETWYRVQLPISQIYTVATDQDIPYNVYGTVQDKSVVWGPSNSRTPYNLAQVDLDPGKVSRGQWDSAGFGNECGYVIPDPRNNDLVWSTGSSDGPNGGTVILINRKTGHWRIVTVKPRFTTGTAPVDLDYRFHWHLPLAASAGLEPDNPDCPSLVYAGSQYVHATDDYGLSWHEISPELTGYDPDFLQSSGGLTTDDINVRMAYTLSAITASPCQPGTVWVGTSDQRLWRGTYESEWKWNWEELNFDQNIVNGELPVSEPGAWGLISCIALSKTDPDSAYVTIDRHQADDSNPYIFKTTDGGRHWHKIVDGIPVSPVSYVHWIAEDPCSKILFAGTENALYIAHNCDGRCEWEVLPGLPPTPISGITVQEHFSDLVLSTFGRGFWIVDDITPLRQLELAESQAPYLFDMPRPLYRFQLIGQRLDIPHAQDPTIGSDPPGPAPINFYLSEPAKVTLKFFSTQDNDGKPVRTVEIAKSDTVSGINRYWWNLMSDSTKTIKLRTKPANQVDIQFCPNGIRPYNSPIAGTTIAYLVPIGSYKVSLEVDGEPVCEPRHISVLRDPTEFPGLGDDRVKDIVAVQTDLLRKLQATLNTVVADINAMEFVRFQIEQLAACSELKHPDGKPYSDAWISDLDTREWLCALDGEILAIEDCLYQKDINGQGEDLARFPARLVENLGSLGGIVAGAGDGVPSRQHVERYEALRAEVDDRHACWCDLMARIKSDINPPLVELGVPVLLFEPPNAKPCPEIFVSGQAF